MYWVYLLIFILAVLTPKIIQDGAYFLREEDLESVVLFCFGVLSFTLYLVKEKALFRVFQEKLRLQKKTNSITKDLSDSYSYIGGMNRKFDIVKDLIFHLPKDTADTLSEKQGETYQSILRAVKVLSKVESVSLRFVDIKLKKVEKTVEIGPSGKFDLFDAPTLLKSKKVFWENNECAVVRSPRQAKNVVAFIIFPKITNQVEDVEMFKILASQALLLFCIDWYTIPRSDHVNVSEKNK